MHAMKNPTKRTWAQSLVPTCALVRLLNTQREHPRLISCSIEIIEYSAPDEVAVCNLASLALPKFVSDGAFDFDKLHKVTKVVAKNLNRVIDVNYYPVDEAKNSNMRHRP